MQIRTLIFCTLGLFLLGFTGDTTKNKYPQDYFRAPINGIVRVTGTFGELRPDHFHSGIDIKPNLGTSGQPILAAASGYIARIKVESSGYGRAIYIRHPNGYTTLYAHLESFSKEIEDYVQKEQYRLQRFDLNLYPAKEKFPVQKGQTIGKMGTTGSSSAPHLHFEIRESATDDPINPLLFGYKPEDNIPPKMHQLKVYHLNEKRETIGSRTINLVKTPTGYGIKGDTIEIGAWRAGFALKVFDHMNKTNSWNGIYSLQMSRNDSVVYSFVADKFDFDETRYHNAHIDYEEQITQKSYFNRCYLLPGNQLSMYPISASQAITGLYKDRPQEIKIVAKDYSGNSTILRFWVKRGDVKPHDTPTFDYLFAYDRINVLSTGNIDAHFQKGTFYENCYLNYSSTPDSSEGCYSAVHHLHDFKTPVHRYFDLSIAPSRPVPSHLRDKAFIAYCSKPQKVLNCGGYWNGEKLLAKTRMLGDYCIMVDKEAPTIQAVTFGTVMTGQSKMTFKIKDNFDPVGHARKLQFRATVDGKWILMEYDLKNSLLIHRFDGRIEAGEHLLRLEVWDDRGNKAVLEEKFTR